MKKHILSNYLKNIKMLVQSSVDNTILTESTETSDADELRLYGTFTKHSGPDETMTHSIETSDPDELYDTTKTTFTVEQSDPDEFALA